MSDVSGISGGAVELSDRLSVSDIIKFLFDTKTAGGFVFVGAVFKPITLGDLVVPCGNGFDGMSLDKIIEVVCDVIPGYQLMPWSTKYEYNRMYNPFITTVTQTADMFIHYVAHNHPNSYVQGDYLERRVKVIDGMNKILEFIARVQAR